MPGMTLEDLDRFRNIECKMTSFAMIVTIGHIDGGTSCWCGGDVTKHQKLAHQWPKDHADFCTHERIATAWAETTPDVREAIIARLFAEVADDNYLRSIGQ
jgi:hypothetical protein